MAMLDGPRVAPSGGGPARQLVVLVHGLGADGADLIGLAPEFAAALPEAAFVAPDAPDPCEGAPFGRQWFPIGERDPERMAAGLRAVAPSVQAFIDAELARHGLGVGQLALLGFSQGAMTALFVGLQMAPPPAAIVAYSGALLVPDVLVGARRARAPVLLVHGTADEVVPVMASQAAEAALRGAGVAVEAVYVPGLGHGIDGTGIHAARAMLTRAFARDVTD